MSSRKQGLWLLFAGAVLFFQQELPAQRAVPPPPEYRQQPPFDLKRLLHTTGDWQAVVTALVEPVRELENGEGPSLSRICFVRENPGASECTYFRDLFHSDLTLQVFSSLTTVTLKSRNDAAHGVELEAAGLYPSGQTHETAIWAYDASRDDWHLAFAGQADNEVRILNSGALNGMLVTSDWRRDEGDTRWSDHKRDIRVYRYGSNGGDAGYRKVLEYTTAKKYGAEDTATIGAELNDIEARLR